MKCTTCNADGTKVTTTAKHLSGGVLRRRKCYDCGATFATLERVFTIKPIPKPPKPQAMYSRQDAALINRIKTEIRRRNEDTKEDNDAT